MSFGILTVPTAANAYTTTGCRWSTGTLNIDTRYVNGDSRTAIYQAFTLWSTYSHVNLAGATSGSFSAQNTNYGATGWEGNTSWACPLFGQTTSAQARLNDYYAASYPTARKKVVWLHELGHGLGLDHVGGVLNVMYSSASTAYLNGVTSPSSDDSNGINSLY